MTVKSSISLTDAQAAFARGLVEAGRFPSVSAAVQQGLELLRIRIETDEADLNALRTLLIERQKGPFISSEEIEKSISKSARELREKYGV
jgi:antitoxin ParD1/3/4